MIFVVDVCKKKWTALRKQYCEIRNGKRGTTGTGAKKRVSWAYYELLSFLDDGIRAKEYGKLFVLICFLLSYVFVN